MEKAGAVQEVAGYSEGVPCRLVVSVIGSRSPITFLGNAANRRKSKYKTSIYKELRKGVKGLRGRDNWKDISSLKLVVVGGIRVKDNAKWRRE